MHEYIISWGTLLRKSDIQGDTLLVALKLTSGLRASEGVLQKIRFG